MFEFQPDSSFFTPLGIWMMVVVASSLFFYFNTDAELKRKLWPMATVGIAALFVWLVMSMGFPDQALLFVVPAVIVFALLNLRMVSFCDKCGAPILKQNLTTPAEVCTKCGAKLG